MSSGSPNPAKGQNPQVGGSDANLAGKELHLQETCDYNTDAAALVQILDEYLSQLKAGTAPSRTELMERYPEFAAQLEACLAGLEFLHGVEQSPASRPQRLGDFQILREVGRGGMGAVFEATQLSLGRRVALKILRFGGVSDPEAIERFQREAETIAKLHHTNIVPVYAVGSERGVNYYAMQFIDGQSLAEVFAARKGPLKSSQVAEWGLQAAEALSHAHKRGVIHRDVKPSNLILDKDGRLWLTDFGLARRAGDVTLSLTGALLGTPRYMSPEQAMAAHKQVDHRSDIFSLGTTLYELLAQKPAFQGDTPHDVIQHILSVEPVPLRQIVPTIPRDLETIIHKCLAKDPVRRYESAHELAEDLRAFIEGRPIRARRASLIEQAAHWIKHQQRSVKLAGAAAAVTLCAITMGTVSWSSYQAWRQSSLQLETPTAPLVAEILQSSGESVAVETVPTQQAVELPAGDYQVRASKEGTLSQTFELTLERGKVARPSLELRDQMLFPPFDLERSFSLVDLGNEHAVVLLNKEGLGLRKCIGPAFGWENGLKPQSSPLFEKFPGFRWAWNSGRDSYSGYGTYDIRPWIVEQSFDVNGDGTRDLIVAARHQAWVMAVSGVDGTVLWFEGRSDSLKEAPKGVVDYPSYAITSAVQKVPLVVPDADEDGVPDLVFTFADVVSEEHFQDTNKPKRQWVEAFSGKLGKSLWRYDIPEEWLTLPAGQKVPLEMRWFCLSSSGMMSHGGGSWVISGTRHRVSQAQYLERTGHHLYSPDVQLVSVANSQRIAILAGEKLVWIDPSTGKLFEEPLSLGLRCGMEPQWAECDGDGIPDLVMLVEAPPVPPATLPQPQIAVWSTAKKQLLWERKCSAEWPHTSTWTTSTAAWPIVTDLDGDGKSEVIAPDHQSSTGILSFNANGIPWGMIKAWAGDTGAELWSRRLVSMERQIDSVTSGPDIDGDGHCEIFAATLVGQKCLLYVDALSGKTGESLWTSEQDPKINESISSRLDLLRLQWWHCGSQMSPQLLVHIISTRFGGDREQEMLCALDAKSGKLKHTGAQIAEATPVDLDHDGCQELLLFTSKSPNARDWGGKLHAIRGVGEEPWRKLATLGEAVSDLDGDEVDDLVRVDQKLIATSGRTGKRLWTRELNKQLYENRFRSLVPSRRGHRSQSEVQADLDGDGSNDLLAWGHGAGGKLVAPFHAISGKTGRVLWNSKSLKCQTMVTVLAAESHNLQGKQERDVLILASLDFGYPERSSFSSHESQLWLFALSGKDGSLRWATPMSTAYGKTPGNAMPLQLAGISLSLSVGDLNGDGVKDVLAPGLTPDGTQLATVALDGRQGTVLWRRAFPSGSLKNLGIGSWIAPTICDPQGDGHADVAIVEYISKVGSNNPMSTRQQVLLVEGSTGDPKWSWQCENDFAYWSLVSGFGMADLMRPVVFQRTAKEQMIGVLNPGQLCQMVLLDANGVAQTKAVALQSMATGIWATDLEKDGIDEILFSSDSVLMACRLTDLDHPLWSKPLGETGQYPIINIYAGSNGQKTPWIALGTPPTNNSVLGVDAATGKTLWTCPGPSLRDSDGVYHVASAVSLLGGKGTETPFVYYAYDSVARCRQGVSLSPASTTPSGDASSKMPNVTKVVRQADWRWKRDLPWLPSSSSWKEIQQLVGWGLLFAVTLVVVPAAYFYRLVTRRRFSLRTLMLLSVVVGLFLASLQTTLPAVNDFQGVANRIFMGMAFSPVVIGVAFLAMGVWQRQWRRLGVWLSIAFATTVVAAAFGIITDLRKMPMLVEESYDWSGLPWIAITGFYLACWMALIALPISHFWRRVRPVRS